MARQTFSDDYEHSSEDIEYILENILQDDDGSEEYKALAELFQSSLINGCICEACDEKCAHGGNYNLTDDGLVLSDDRRCRDLIYECNDSCRCTSCSNKLAQYGPIDGLSIQSSDSKGFGLFATDFIPRGSFVCEYVGEVLTKIEANRRDRQNQKENKMNYIFCLNEISSGDGSTIQTFVDPSRKGNIGRYINHSCDANCSIISTRVNSFIPKIAIFANRDILPSTEITFNYGYDQTSSPNKFSKKCLCASANCKLYLPNFSF